MYLNQIFYKIMKIFNISKNTIDKFFLDKKNKLEKEIKPMKIQKLVDLLKNNKIYIPDTEYQRPFSPKLKQSLEILHDINSNRMIQSISLIDHEKQIKYLELEKCNIIDDEEIKKIENEINYYYNLYCSGLFFSLVDGQHRANYIMEFIRSINNFKLEEIYKDHIESFLNIELNSCFVWGVRQEDYIEIFRSINTNKKVTGDVMMWGIDTSFNTDLKNLGRNDKRLDFFKDGSPEEKNRNNYKNWYSILKICGSYENPKLCTSSVGMTQVQKWLEYDNINNYQDIIDIYERDFIRIYNTLENINGEYDIFNLYFILHQLKIRNIILDDNSIKELSYICHSNIDAREDKPKRYKSVINEINKFLL